MTEEDTVIFVSIAILRVCRKFLLLKWNKFPSNISFIKSPRVDVVIGGLGL